MYMELLADKIKHLKNEQIYEQMSSVINKIYYDFEYINISKIDYKEIVLQLIQKYKEDFMVEEHFQMQTLL